MDGRKAVSSASSGKRLQLAHHALDAFAAGLVLRRAFPFEEGQDTTGHLTGALIDRLTHHVHILTMNSDSYP